MCVLLSYFSAILIDLSYGVELFVVEHLLEASVDLDLFNFVWRGYESWV